MMGNVWMKSAALLGLVLLAVPEAVAQKVWSLNDEVYACGKGGMTFEELASAGVTLVSHAPWGGEGKTLAQARAIFDKAHRHGIKLIPYVTLYKAIDFREVTDTSHTRAHPFYRELDLVAHPEWALIDENGNIRRPFDNPGYRGGVHQSCTNVAGIADAYVRGVRNVMELGADGVFVDNVHPCSVCYGPKFGKHEHLYPDKDNLYTFHLALKRVYELVKKYGKDKAVILNTGTGLNPRYEDCGDGFMEESYVCTFVKNRRENRWQDWKTIQEKTRRQRDYIASGKAIVALSYLGHTNMPTKDDAFYSAACAGLSDFIWTGHIRSEMWGNEAHWKPDHDVIRLIQRTRLGSALGNVREEGSITYRLYQKGIVAVNPRMAGAQASLLAPPATQSLCDLYSGHLVPAREGRLTVTIPGASARYYIHPDDAYASFLEECRLAARGIPSYFERQANDRSIPSWTVRDKETGAGQGEVSIDRLVAHSGKASLRITSEGNGTPVWANRAGMRCSQERPRSYAVSYWARVSPGCDASVRLRFEADFLEGGHGWFSPPQVTSSEWTYVQATCPADRRIDDIEVFCEIPPDQTGTVWIDDLVVQAEGGPSWTMDFEFEKQHFPESRKEKLQQWAEVASRSAAQLLERFLRLPVGSNRERLLRELQRLQEEVAPLVDGETDDEIRGRLRQHSEYAGRVISLATGTTLTIQAPNIAIPGKTTRAELTCRNGSLRAIKQVLLRLDLPKGWTSKILTPPSESLVDPNQAEKAIYEITVPSSAALDFPVTLTATMVYTEVDSGRTLAMVQRHGMSVTKKMPAGVVPEPIDPQERLKLHANPED